MRKPITQYLEYRQFLRDFYEDKKAEDGYFSYRYISKKVGLDHGYLIKVFQEKVHIAVKHINKFSKLCKLTPKETEEFC